MLAAPSMVNFNHRLPRRLFENFGGLVDTSGSSSVGKVGYLTDGSELTELDAMFLSDP